MEGLVYFPLKTASKWEACFQSGSSRRGPQLTRDTGTPEALNSWQRLWCKCCVGCAFPTIRCLRAARWLVVFIASIRTKSSAVAVPKGRVLEVTGD